MFDAYINYLIDGLVLGSIYAITSTGLVVTYNTSGVFNFAHGAVGMITAFTYWDLVSEHHWALLPAALLVLLVEAPAIGALIELVFMRRLHGASEERPIMVTIGLMVVMLGIGVAVWGESSVTVPLFFGSHYVYLFGDNRPDEQFLIVGTAAVVAVGLRLLFYRTRRGIAMCAVVDDPELLALSGASPSSVSRMGWMLGSFLAALAGILIAGVWGQTSSGFNVESLTLLVVSGYAAAVVGRLRSIPLTFAGAMGLGVVQQFIAERFNNDLSPALQTQMGTSLPILFLLVALVLVPSARLRAGRLATAALPRVPKPRESMVVGAGFIALAVALAFVLPSDMGQPTASILSLATIGTGLLFGIIGLSLVLLTGYAGQISLCQMVFLGIGGCVMGKVAGGDSVIGLVVAVLVSAAVGALVSLPFLRLRGLYLALGTFAFAVAMYEAVFGGFSGLMGSDNSVNVGRIAIPGIVSFASDRAEFLLIAVMFVISAWFVLGIRRSSFGRRLVALSDSPAACATLGLNTAVTKAAVFAMSAGLAGLAGALYGTLQSQMQLSDVDFIGGLAVLLILTIFGIRTVTGALGGGIAYAILVQVQTDAAGKTSTTSHWLVDIAGLVAGVGIIALGRLPHGMLSIPWVTERVRLPWVKEEPLARLTPMAVAGEADHVAA